MMSKRTQITPELVTIHPNVTMPAKIGPALVERCPKCRKWGQAKVRFRGRRMYLYFDHYGMERNRPTTHHITYNHSCYIGKVPPETAAWAMRWRTRKLMRENRAHKGWATRRRLEAL